MIRPKSLDIAVVGNEDQVALMRFAGAQKHSVIENDHNLREKVRAAFKEFERDPSIGIILIPQNWMVYIHDLLKYLVESKRTTPVIVEIPSKFEMEKRDVREFYKSYTRKLLGFSIEI